MYNNNQYIQINYIHTYIYTHIYLHIYTYIYFLNMYFMIIPYYLKNVNINSSFTLNMT